YRQGGAFVRATRLPLICHRRWQLAMYTRSRTLPSLCSFAVPLVPSHHDFSRPQTASGCGVDQYGRSAYVGRRMEIQGARSDHWRTVRPPTLYIGRSAIHRARQCACAVGQEDRHHRQQRVEEIIRMFNSAFDDITGEHTDYYPAARRPEIDGINKRVYETLNNGVYRCGLATKQQVYEKA